MEKKYLKISTPVFVFAVLFFAPFLAQAATLDFSPASITRTVGSTFSVTVYVSSIDKALNAVSGVVSFPKEKLEVVGLSKKGSVINLWVEEPTFSNAQGTVNFEGIALNPGYLGSKGNVINITFRAKSEGTANINFASGHVLANDGAGTNILNSMGKAAVSIQKISPVEEIKPVEKTKTEIPETKETETEKFISLDMPIITHYPEEIEAGEFIKIQGIASPGADVEVRLLNLGEIVQQKKSRSTASGNFLVVLDAPSKSGVYTFLAEAIDEAGNRSKETPKFTLVVNSKLSDRLMELIFSYLSVALVLGLILVGIVVSALFVWYRSLRIVRRLRSENREAEKMLEKSFNLLRKDLREHTAKLQTAKTKRELSSEELDFLEKFDEELIEAGDVAKKEMRDIFR